MTFSVRPFKKGDVLRVGFGKIYHFGIYVSDKEVVQFGLPPVGKRSKEELVVLATDLKTFACGNTVEAADFDEEERKTRFSPREIVKRAKKRLGEDGYNVLHNNCEHFVYECAFGVKYSEQEEKLKEWARRNGRFDVYVATMPDDLVVEEVYPRSRWEYIEKFADEEGKKERFFVWKLLEYAAKRSYGKDLTDLTFERVGDRFFCKEFRFSFSHCHGLCAVAVSDGAVGTDVEREDLFYAKFPIGSDKEKNLIKKIRLPGEEGEAIELWVKKEALFKKNGGEAFCPQEIDVSKAKITIVRKDGFVLASCGEYLPSMRLYQPELRK